MPSKILLVSERQMRKFNYDFIPQGAMVQVPESLGIFTYDDGKGNKKEWKCSNTVIVDTGNKLQEGIIDHHQPASENACVASIIVNSPGKYLNHLIGRDEITMVTHFSPDLDAIASCYLIEKYLKDGSFSELDVLLSIYVNEVDSGKLTMDPEFPVTVASMILAINESLSRKNLEILEESFRLLDEVFRLLETDRNLWGDQFLKKIKGFDGYRKKIIEDVETYRLDFQERSETDTFELLNTETNIFEQVDFIITKNPESFLWKYWVRGDTKNSPQGEGFIFTCALRDRQDNFRAVIATDPTTPFYLKGLGLLLDSMEVRALLAKRETKDGLINQARDGFHRNDPWYDGRNPFHNYTIIGAPGGGSKLSDNEIMQAIRACELWIKIGASIHEGAPFADFDTVMNLPVPLAFSEIEQKVFTDFIAADAKRKQSLWSDLMTAAGELQRLSPDSFFEKQDREKLRSQLSEELLHYYEAVPHKEKESWGAEITDLLADAFPPSFIQQWVIRTSYLPPETLREALNIALRFIPMEDRFLYLAKVQDNHRKASAQLGSDTMSGSIDVTQQFATFFRIFGIPETPLPYYEENPLFLFHDSSSHFEDILVCTSLADGDNIGSLLPKSPGTAGNPVIQEIDSFRQETSETISSQIMDRWFGNNYENLRQKRNNLLNAGITSGMNLVKRHSITRITTISYHELRELLSPMFSGLDTGINEVYAYKKDLDFLLSIRRFESLLDRYCVFLRLKAVTTASGQTPLTDYKENPGVFEFLSFLADTWETAIEFIRYEDKKLFLERIKKTVMKLNHMKASTNAVSAFSALSVELFKFYSRMLEEQEAGISSAGKNLEICFIQYESLKTDGVLLSKASELPAYFRHILHEVLLTYRRYYREKIRFLQSEFQYVIESDSMSTDDNNLYVDFCNEILLRTIVYDWKEQRKNVFEEEDPELIKKFFKKYFHWQRVTNGVYEEKSPANKKEITKLNSEIRFAEGKVDKGIKAVVEAIPATDEIHGLDGHLELLKHHRDFASEASYLPLNLYYDTHDYLTERYISTFDIRSVAESISSFSTKFPPYIRWFSNTGFLRTCVIVLVALLFLMGVFDPNTYQFNGEPFRPPLPEMALALLGPGLFAALSGLLVFFWSLFIGIAFLAPIVFVIYKLISSTYQRLTAGHVEKYTFIKTLQRIEGKKSKLLYLGFIIPLILIVIQMARPGTIDMISHFEGLRLLSSVIIIFMLTVYSIYLDVSQRNPQKPPKWILNRTNHMFWLYNLQALVITVFVIDFLLRFQLSISAFDGPEELVTLGISRYIVLQYHWFDIVLMPLFTVIISFLTLFFSFFINRIFK